MTVQYLIDSENVGDFWIPLLELPVEETELIVFYTRNSPHMSYDSLIRLKESNRTVTFIKCYEGTNALDFQLVSELGYRICECEGGRFVIVTNDTGFDAAVKYWRRRKKSVKRITGKEAKNIERRIREDLRPEHTQDSEPKQETVPVRRYTAVEHDAEHDAHVDAYHAESSRDPDGRPSRSNLRDVESALEPEVEESVETGEEYPSVEDIEMEYYEPEDEELNEDSFREEDDSGNSGKGEDECDGSASYESAEDAAGAADPEDEPADYETRDQAGESCLTAEAVTSEPLEEQAELSDAEEEIIREYADLWAGEDSGPESPSGDRSGEGHIVLVEGDQLDFIAQIEPEPVSEPSVADGAEEDNEKTDPANDSLPEAADPSSVSETENESGTEESAETQHRGRTRRSRSRRSRSSSKKQDQQAGPEESRNDVSRQEEAAAEQEHNDEPSAGSPSMEAVTGAFDSSMPPGDEEIARIVACIGADNLAELHNQLATFYGDQGKDIYLSIKNNARSLQALNPDLKQKFAYYCEIIFVRSDYTGEYPADISEFLLSVREKLNNLNSLRYALQKHYGKEKGRRFYFLLKPFAKTMYQM